MNIRQRNEEVIKYLDPAMQIKVRQLIHRCELVGIRFLIVSGFRSAEEQDDLHEQGRKKPGRIVTWVRGGWSMHQFGVAIDVVPVVFSIPMGHTTPEKESKLQAFLGWSASRLYRRIAGIASGINMERPYPVNDRGHLTYTQGLKIDDLRAGESPDYVVARTEVKAALNERKRQIEDALQRPPASVGRGIRLRVAYKRVERELERL